MTGPAGEQLALAESVSLTLRPDLPAPVAAAVLQHHLQVPLLHPMQVAGDIPSVLGEMEAELDLPITETLITGTRAELSAWFESRYMVKTLRGLRALQPNVGDVVRCSGWGDEDHRIVSSIGENGRIYAKGRPSRKAWPHNLEIVSRVGQSGHTDLQTNIGNRLTNSIVSRSTNLDNYARLSAWKLDSHTPSGETVRELEELLESGERYEAPLQDLLERHPQLLAPLVVGGWATYVIPRPQLGSEYVPDFLVLGINSAGPQWVVVEIEAARHSILNRRGRLSGSTKHAIGQIDDWREWLLTNVMYVQNQHGFHGLTTLAPGLVIIGRADPVGERVASRARESERGQVAVRSWDWLLRSATVGAEDGLYRTEFAVENLNRLANASSGDGGEAAPETRELDELMRALES